ncbi:MAG TPA: VOC family protein [Acidimicrobiales bacterium]|nr:VOC family protein [Acidimicrobiales bacterium]
MHTWYRSPWPDLQELAYDETHDLPSERHYASRLEPEVMEISQTQNQSIAKRVGARLASRDKTINCSSLVKHRSISSLKGGTQVSVQPRLVATSLDHLVLYVQDIERSKRFYMNLLGFVVTHEHLEPSAVPPTQEEFDVDIRCFLKCGNNQLGLFLKDSGVVHGGGEVNHMALTLSDVDEAEVRRILAEENIEILSRLGDPSCIYIKDPDGHNIQLLPR